MTGSNQCAGPRLRLVTFNVQNLGQEDWPVPARYEEKLGGLALVLRGLDPDLAAVQEIREPESFHELGRRSGLAGSGFLADPPVGRRHIQTGLLTRLPVLDRGQLLDFPAAVPGQAGRLNRLEFRRPVPWLLVRLPNGERLFAVAVHLKSHRPEYEALPPGLDSDRREPLARALAESSRILEAAGVAGLVSDAMNGRWAEHYTVIGDFNDPAGSTVLELVTAGAGDEDGPGCGERLCLVRPCGDEPVSYVGRAGGELIDHILVSQRLFGRLERAGVEHQLFGDWPGAALSDHVPVWADFRLEDFQEA